MREKNIDSNLLIAVLAIILDGIIFLWSILDLSIQIPEQLRWTIFAITAIIIIIFGYRFLSKKSTENAKPPKSNTKKGTTTMNIANQETLSGYLKLSKLKSHYNNVDIRAAKFFVALYKSNKHKNIYGVKVKQKIQWSFEGTNVGYEPMASFSMRVSLSAYTSWKDGSVRLGGSLKLSGNRSKFEFQKQDITIDELTDGQDVRLLTFHFPQGIKCDRGGQFKLTIDMVWMREADFHDIECYFADPQNYGRNVNQLDIEVKTNMDELMHRSYCLYSVEKDDTNVGELMAEPQIDAANKKISWRINNPLNKLYVVEIVK